MCGNGGKIFFHTLKDIDAIVTEVSCTELYEGCALIEDLDAFLLKQGFRRVNTIVNMFSWGDALYVRKHFLTQRPRTS